MAPSSPRVAPGVAHPAEDVHSCWCSRRCSRLLVNFWVLKCNSGQHLPRTVDDRLRLDVSRAVLVAILATPGDRVGVGTRAERSTDPRCLRRPSSSGPLAGCAPPARRRLRSGEGGSSNPCVVRGHAAHCPPPLLLGRDRWPARRCPACSSSTRTKSTTSLHPVFYGNYDWHSAVHSHWCLCRLLRRHADSIDTPAVAEALQDSMTQAGCQAEADYFRREGAATFERPYGCVLFLRVQTLRTRAHGAYTHASRHQ